MSKRALCSLLYNNKNYRFIKLVSKKSTEQLAGPGFSLTAWLEILSVIIDTGSLLTALGLRWCMRSQFHGLDVTRCSRQMRIPLTGRIDWWRDSFNLPTFKPASLSLRVAAYYRACREKSRWTALPTISHKSHNEVSIHESTLWVEISWFPLSCNELVAYRLCWVFLLSIDWQEVSSHCTSIHV